MNTGANFSPDGIYRYSLWRIWGEDNDPHLIVIGLNPSTADATEDDPTIRRCIGFAKREQLAGLVMLNLFALRATDPKIMLAHADPIGPQTDSVIRINCRTDSRDIIIAAWGTHGSHRGRGKQVADLIPNLRCFGKTKDGHPKHPLYLRADTPIIDF